jgi:hypothetical protein
VPADQPGGRSCQQPSVGAGPRDVVHVPVVRVDAEEEGGVDAVVGGKGRVADVPQRDVAVVRAACEEEAGFFSVRSLPTASLETLKATPFRLLYFLKK